MAPDTADAEDADPESWQVRQVRRLLERLVRRVAISLREQR